MTAAPRQRRGAAAELSPTPSYQFYCWVWGSIRLAAYVHYRSISGGLIEGGFLWEFGK